MDSGRTVKHLVSSALWMMAGTESVIIEWTIHIQISAIYTQCLGLWKNDDSIHVYWCNFFFSFPLDWNGPYGHTHSMRQIIFTTLLPDLARSELLLFRYAAAAARHLISSPSSTTISTPSGLYWIYYYCTFVIAVMAVAKVCLLGLDCVWLIAHRSESA